MKYKKHSIFAAIASLFLGCTKPTYTTQELQDAKQKAFKEAVVLTSIQPRIEKQLLLFQTTFSSYERKEIARHIPTLYAPNAFLNDRIHTVIGQENIARYFDDSFEKMHQTDFKIQQMVWGEKDVFITWIMRIQLKEKGPWMDFLGATQLIFNHEGQIIYHQDYWDFSELMGQIRGLRSLVNYVKSQA